MSKQKAKTVSKPFSKVLDNLLQERGLGIREAARLASVAPSTIMDWRTGSTPSDYLAVKKLAHGLGVSLEFLLTGEDGNSVRTKIPAVYEVFDHGEVVFEGYAKVKVQRLVEKKGKRTE